MLENTKPVVSPSKRHAEELIAVLTLTDSTTRLSLANEVAIEVLCGVLTHLLGLVKFIMPNQYIF